MQRLSPLSKQYDSDPDLSNIGARKRKNDHEIMETFKAFTENILSKMDSWKLEVNNSLMQINETLNKVIKDDLAKLKEESLELKREIKNIRKEYNEIRTCTSRLDRQQSEMKKEITEIQKSVLFTGDLHDDYKKKLNSLSGEIKTVDGLRVEIKNLKEQNRQITLLLNSNEQRDRLLNIELVGIPETNNEVLSEYISKIGKHVGVDILTSEIIQINRISPKVKYQGRPRVIVAKLQSRLLKDNLISLARKNRLTTKDIDIAGEARPIFINEHLTSYNKQLLKKCKELAKTKVFQYVWTKNGRIFMRQNDTSPALQIFDEEDLLKKTRTGK